MRHERSGGARTRIRALPPNDPRQYDDLADEWWKPNGRFAALHWLAAARGTLVPRAKHAGAVLLDLACGGGFSPPPCTATSSATLVLVLDELRATGGIGSGDYVVCLAFGPGLTLYAALLRQRT